MIHIKLQFKNWELPAFKDDNGEAWVAVRPIAEAIGLAYNSQWTKLKGNPAFNCYDIITVASDGKQRKLVCLPVRQLYGWLYGINSRRARADVAPVLLQFQKDVHTILETAFYSGVSKETVQAMAQTIESLRTMVEKLLVRNEALENRMGAMDGFQASIAGRQLARHKQVKSLIH